MSDEAVSLTLSWMEWNINERLKLLDIANIHYEIDRKYNMLKSEFPLSSGQAEVFNFVADPNYPVKFWKLDNTLCEATLEVHYQFWKWRVTR